jgi:peptidoglycan hydrolase-like protein with peptidoglycan-binding domain
MDNDGDGLIDSNDPSCKNNSTNDVEAPFVQKAGDIMTYDQSCPSLNSDADHLVFITHGFNSDTIGWAETMRKSISDRIDEAQKNGTLNKDEKWEVCTYNWGNDAGPLNYGSGVLNGLFYTAYTNAYNHGVFVGNKLTGMNYKSIHFIAHSAGSNLIQNTVTTLKVDMIALKGVKKMPIIQTTFLDAFDPNKVGDDYSLYGQFSDYSEQYVYQDPAILGTNHYLPSAYNFDVTLTSKSMDYGATLLFGHGFPIKWYQDSINTSPSYVGASRYGFHLTLESGRSILLKEYIPNGGCILGVDDPCPVAYVPTQPPVITLNGTNPTYVKVDGIFTDPVTASDSHGMNITADIKKTGSVDTSLSGAFGAAIYGSDVLSGIPNTSVAGTYLIHYNVVDSKGLTAAEVTRTVIVGATTILPQCSDKIDNDSDGKIDYPNDSGCTSTTDTDEKNITATATFIFSNDLYYDITHPDVLELQKYLNGHGYPVATSGAGSPGNETTYFGSATQAAVIKLQLANGISPAAGYFGSTTRTFVNTGTLPAVTVLTQCSDGKDNDGDGLIDVKDLGCVNETDNDEKDIVITTACSDKIDNDGDGKIDYPNDPGCLDSVDMDEYNAVTPVIFIFNNDLWYGSASNPATDVLELQKYLNGHGYPIATTGAGSPGYETTFFGLATQAALINFQTVKGISPAAGYFGSITRALINYNTPPPAVVLPICSDGKDNDGDGKVDYPNDIGCMGTTDSDEYNAVILPICSDGVDNDGDGLRDYPADPGCTNVADGDEYNAPVILPACSNGKDDDGDGKVDYPNDPGCTSTTDMDEYNVVILPICSDGKDNDGDGKVDYPNDIGCTGTTDSDEYNAVVSANFIFNTDLSLGMTHPDVLQLQKYLNSHGYLIAASGAGSPGYETTYFGTLTQSAVAKFQTAKGISPAAGYFGSVTRSYINSQPW